MRPPTLAVFENPRALTEVDLYLLAGQALHAPKWRITVGVQSPHEAFDRFVAAGEPVLGCEVLINPLGRESRLPSGLDWPTVRLALAATTRGDPAVRMAGFEPPGPSEPAVGMAGFASSRYLRTVPRSMPSSRAIRRRDHPRVARAKTACCSFTLSWFIAPLVPHRQHRAQSHPSKWLVLNRPIVAGFK